MGLMPIISVVVGALLLAACGGPPALQSDPAAGLRKGTLVTHAGEPMSLFAFAQQAHHVDYLLMGEAHTNACDHAVQADVLQVLASQDLQPVLGLEMVPAAKQPVLDRFNQGRLSVEELPEALDWQTSWGHPYSLYKPVFQVAFDAGVDLYALNIEQAVLDEVRKKGLEGMAPEKRARLPERILDPPEPQRQALEEEFSGHQKLFQQMGNATSGSLERFMLIQSIWDTQMASRARRVHAQTGRPVVILTGTGHVEYDWGIASRLHRWDPQAKIVSVIGWRGGTLPEAEAADWFFYCPLQHTSRLGFTMEMRPEGARVMTVEPGSRAARGGLQSGDLLVKVGGEPFTGLWNLHQAAMDAVQAEEPMQITVKREGASVELGLDLQRSRTTDGPTD